MNQLTTKTRFWVKRAPSQSLPRKLEVRSGNQKKLKKHAWVEHFTPPPNDPPFCTLFVLCMWGEVTDIITHAKFHLNRFSSFGSPGGRNSPFPIDLENGSYNSYALTCYTVMKSIFCSHVPAFCGPLVTSIPRILSNPNFTLTGPIFLLVDFVCTVTYSSPYSSSTKPPLVWFEIQLLLESCYKFQKPPVSNAVTSHATFD